MNLLPHPQHRPLPVGSLVQWREQQRQMTQSWHGKTWQEKTWQGKTWQWMMIAHHTVSGRMMVRGLLAISGALVLWDATLLG